MSDRDDNTFDDPLQDLFRSIAEERRRKFADHAMLRASPPFGAATKQLHRLLMDYATANDSPGFG